MVRSSISRGGQDWTGWGWGGRGLRVAAGTQGKPRLHRGPRQFGPKGLTLPGAQEIPIKEYAWVTE